MKVAVTHLKAPWPEGTQVGSVVEVGDVIPGWAIGKCEPVEGGAERSFVVNPASEGESPAVPAKKAKATK